MHGQERLIAACSKDQLYFQSFRDHLDSGIMHGLCVGKQVSFGLKVVQKFYICIDEVIAHFLWRKRPEGSIVYIVSKFRADFYCLKIFD